MQDLIGYKVLFYLDLDPKDDLFKEDISSYAQDRGYVAVPVAVSDLPTFLAENSFLVLVIFARKISHIKTVTQLTRSYLPLAIKNGKMMLFMITSFEKLVFETNYHAKGLFFSKPIPTDMEELFDFIDREVSKYNSVDRRWEGRKYRSAV